MADSKVGPRAAHWADSLVEPTADQMVEMKAGVKVGSKVAQKVDLMVEM